MGVFEERSADAPLSNPFVVVRDNRGRAVLIWIGRFEALAISMGLEGASSERPMTHELLKNMVERLGARIDRVVVDDLWDSTFYAKIWMTLNGKSIFVDSRPSDAIALALRAKCPLYMTEAVLEEASRPVEEITGGSGSEEEED